MPFTNSRVTSYLVNNIQFKNDVMVLFHAKESSKTLYHAVLHFNIGLVGYFVCPKHL